MRLTVGCDWREARRVTASSMVGSLQRAWCSKLPITCCSSSVWAGEAGEESSVVGSWGVDLPHDGGVYMEGESYSLQPSGRWRASRLGI